MTETLHFFYRVVWNYGIAIILLTVLVRLCMFPLSRKQALGAQKMQELQPEIKRIQEKYKKDVEGRTRAQQELFRKHNYNPLSGCLVLFIQLPIFIGLYRSLQVDIELREAPLIAQAIRWCSNLAAPDMLFDWHWWMPDSFNAGQGMFYLGPYFNLLPILTIGLFIWQQKMFMPPPADEQAASPAEGHEVDDGLHGRDVLQGGQRPVHLLHRLEPLGPGGAEVPAQGQTGRRRRWRRGPQGQGDPAVVDASRPRRRRAEAEEEAEAVGEGGTLVLRQPSIDG